MHVKSKTCLYLRLLIVVKKCIWPMSVLVNKCLSMYLWKLLTKIYASTCSLWDPPAFKMLQKKAKRSLNWQRKTEKKGEKNLSWLKKKTKKKRGRMSSWHRKKKKKLRNGELYWTAWKKWSRNFLVDWNVNWKKKSWLKWKLKNKREEWIDWEGKMNWPRGRKKENFDLTERNKLRNG